MARPSDQLPSLAEIRAGLYGGPRRTTASIAAARAATRGRPADEAWEACVARGLLPQDWISPPFRPRTDRPGLQTDVTPSAVAAIAADAPGLATVLALVREWDARLQACGELPMRLDRTEVLVVDARKYLFNPYNALTDQEMTLLSTVPAQAGVRFTQVLREADLAKLYYNEHERILGALMWDSRDPDSNPFAPVVACYAYGYVPNLRLFIRERPFVYYPIISLMPLSRS